MSVVKNTDYVGGMLQDFRTNPGRQQGMLIEHFYLRYLTELACNRFKWTGLPQPDDEGDKAGDIRVRYLELTLFRYAGVVFFRHDKDTLGPNSKVAPWDKFLAVRMSAPGPLDMYFDPTVFHLYGNGQTPGVDGLTISADKAVPIWANYMRTPDLDMISIYTRRLATFDRTVEINAKGMRHPFILAADIDTQKSVQEMYRSIDEGQHVIYVTSSMKESLANMVSVLNMEIDPDMITNLLIDKKKIWQECLTFLGINNANQDKRERLVQSEVSANDSEVLAARNIALDARQEAVEKINKKWGLNIKVEWNVNIDAMADMPAMAIGNKTAEEIEGGTAEVRPGMVRSKEGAK